MKRPMRTKLFERRREVGNLALAGWTHAAIARHRQILQAAPSCAVCIARSLTGRRCHSPGLPNLPKANRAGEGRKGRGDGRGSARIANSLVSPAVYFPRSTFSAPATHARQFGVDTPICAHRHDVVAQKGRLCATRRFVREYGVSPQCVRACSDFRMISGDGAVSGEHRSAATQVLVRIGEAATKRRSR